MATLDVYSRQGCHLCEILIEELLALVRRRISVEVHDIDADDEWRARYDIRVPVVEYCGDVICEHRLEPEKVLAVLQQLPGQDA